MQFDGIIAFDTETTGLYPYSGDLPFGFAFADHSKELYLDSRDGNIGEIKIILKTMFGTEENTILMHNAKFDMHHVYMFMEGDIEFNAKIICTATLARIVNNDRFQTSLAVVAKEYGMEKSKAVDVWIRKNKAYKKVTSVTGDTWNEPDFTQVPRSIIEEYAKLDARIAYELYFKLLEDCAELQRYLESLNNEQSIYNIIEKEADVTKSLFEVEKTGVLIDSSYARRAYEAEGSRASDAAKRYSEITGRDFIDSGKSHAAAFIDSGFDESKLPKTEAGNYSFANEVLSSVDSPIAKSILEYRESAKKTGTEYGGILNFRGKDGRLHTSFRQDATRTFRLSSQNINLQNIGSKKTNDHFGRDCFIPPPDYSWVSMDYKAQEMRLLFDLSGEEEIAERIKNGEDPHAVTAGLMGVERKQAKTIAFALVYGMGITKMAKDLGVSMDQARSLRTLFFNSMPKAGAFIKAVIEKAERGFIANKYGRVFRFNRDTAYKAVNHLIQGMGSEIAKTALIEIIKRYKQDKIQVVSLIHDEVNFNIHKDHLQEIENLKQILINSYIPNFLPMDVDVSISEKSWGDC